MIIKRPFGAGVLAAPPPAPTPRPWRFPRLQRAAATPPERPAARRSAVLLDFGWCWTGVSGWGRGAPQGGPGGTAPGRGQNLRHNPITTRAPTCALVHAYISPPVSSIVSVGVCMPLPGAAPAGWSLAAAVVIIDGTSEPPRINGCGTPSDVVPLSIGAGPAFCAPIAAAARKISGGGIIPEEASCIPCAPAIPAAMPSGCIPEPLCIPGPSCMPSPLGCTEAETCPDGVICVTVPLPRSEMIILISIGPPQDRTA